MGRTYRLDAWKSDPTFDKLNKVSPLTIVRTANPFFADYAPGNASVFSMLDDLSVPGMTDWYISDATISYTVVGWHSDSSLDPLAKLGTQTLADRLKACHFDLSTAGFTALQTHRFGDQSKQANCLVVGQYNNIGWEELERFGSETFLPLTWPADKIQGALTDAHPVAVGTNIVDTLIAYVNAQPPAISTGSDLQALLKRLWSFVSDLNTDSVDSQLEAEDLLSTNNFLTSGQGKKWTFSIPASDDTSSSSTKDNFTQVPDGDVANLVLLNAAQCNLESVNRDIHILQQQLFDQYWTFTVDLPKYQGLPTYEAWRSKIAGNVTSIKTLASTNKNMASYYLSLVNRYSSNAASYTYPLKFGAANGFYMQSDPTIMIAGAGSQYGQDPIKDLPVRLDGSDMYTVADGMHSTVDALGMYFTTPNNAMPFASLNLDRGGVVEPRTPAIGRALAEGQFAVNGYDPKSQPYYGPEHFNGQNGWFPLFLEYEVEYINIPFQYWSFQPCGPERRIGYSLKDGLDVSEKGLLQDYRVLKGRSTILPHASSALKTSLNQVFAKINPDQLSQILNGDLSQKNIILDLVSGLDYLSTTLQGLTSQLLTRETGTHVNPIAYINGAPKLTPGASAAISAVGFVEQDFYSMASADGDVMQTTPFAGLTPIPANPASCSPFKPVTHGQMRFTKLNIIDRWGQVVQAIRPNYDPQTGWGTNALYPCLGEAYSVAALSIDKPNTANTVLQRNDGLNSFVQLPPSINQPARMNADFITPWAGSPTVMRPLEEFENPVHGWMLLNYANQSLQIFSAAGEFVREYSVANGTLTTRPFTSNTTMPSGVAQDDLLSQLLKQLTDTGYLINLFNVLTNCVANIEASPSHYAESMLSTLGRPIALVTFGVSMQLQDRPRKNLSTIVPSDSGVRTLSLTQDYTFQWKLGDKDNVFDGLYGYFPNQQGGASNRPPSYDFSKFYSYHDTANPARQPPYFSVTPFWTDASNLTPNGQGMSPWMQAGQKYRCFAGLVDPFVPVHIYTALLPVKLLQLSQSAISRSLGRIRSFFKTGPIISPTLLPPFDRSQTVAQDIVLGDSADLPSTTGTVQIPAANLADWLWLQPYKNPQVGGGDWKTDYNVLGLEDVPTRPGKELAPYQVTEGYLWMKKPFSAAGPVDGSS